MKKFEFELDTVLEYKRGVLEAAQLEYGIIQAQMEAQERTMSDLCVNYTSYSKDYRNKQAAGMLAADALGGQNALRALELEIRRAESKLADLRELVAEKREAVVTAKQETSTIEKLREHRLKDYNKEVQKSEEIFIDEMVSAARSAEKQHTATAEKQHTATNELR